MRFAFLALLVLSGCHVISHRDINGMRPAAQSFAHVEALPVHVAAVEIESGVDEIIVSNDFVFSLYDHGYSYFGNKLSASGVGQDVLVVRFEEANVIGEHVNAQGGVTQALDVGGVDRYRLSLKVALEHRAGDGRVLYGETLAVQQLVGVSEHSSLVQREEAQLKAIEGLFSTLDPEVERVVRDGMRL